MKQSLFLVTALAAATVAGSAMAQMSGALVCEHDAKQVRDYIQQHQSTLSKDKLATAQDQLKLYEGQCSDQSDSASQKLAALRKDLGMQPMDPQSAQMPTTKSK